MALEQVERQLNSVDVEQRRQAVLLLAGQRADEAECVRLLLRAMLDVNWRVRKSAVDVLIDGHPVESYIGGLIGLLYLDENAGARNSAIEALIRLDKKATSSLIESFNTANADVRKFIVDIVGRFRDRKAVPFLISVLGDEDENVRAAAVEHLGELGEPSVVDTLIKILEGDDLWSAYPAADALGRIGDRRALPALLRSLENRMLREPALKAVGRMADAMSLKHIVPFVADRSKAVAYEAVVALEKLYHGGVSEAAITDALREHYGAGLMDILLEHARSTRHDVRGTAILLIGMLRDETALEPLLELSGEEDFREDVKRAMVHIGIKSPESLIPLFETRDIYLKRFICEVAQAVAAPVYYELMDKLTDEDDGHVRALAVMALSSIGEPKAIGRIMRLMTDPYVDVQEAAVEALSGFRDMLDLGELIASLESREPNLRRNVVLLLGRIGAVRAVPALGFMLKDDDAAIRKAVVAALSIIRTEESGKYLTHALTDEDPDIRAAASLSLGEAGYAIDSLRLLVEDPDDMVRVSVAKALGLSGDPRAVADLIKLLRDSNGFVVASAIDSLGRLGGEDACSAVKSMLSSGDREIRRTAIKALAGFDCVADQVLPFLKDEDWATRAAAVDALLGRSEHAVRKEMERAFDREEDPVVRRKLRDYLNA